MANALKYYQKAAYHLEAVRDGYKALLKSISLPNSDMLRVMDIGCGSGRITNEVLLPLLPKNMCEFIGTDISEEMIEFCRSMNTDSRVSFEILDIMGEQLPTHFENRFDLLFSSYCFSYLSNWRQGFLNCRRLLNENGQLFLISQFKTNALYTSYRRMSSTDRWNPYTKDYADYVTPLSGQNADSELKELLEEVGMKLVSHRFDHELCYTTEKRNILDVYLSLDSKFLSIPQDQQNAYKEDFLKVFSEETNFDFTDENSFGDLIDFHFPTVCIHAKKM